MSLCFHASDFYLWLATGQIVALQLHFLTFAANVTIEVGKGHISSVIPVSGENLIFL